MSKSLGNVLSIPAVLSGSGPPNCATTWAVRTTGRCWSSPRPRCRTPSRRTPASRSSCTGCAAGSAPWCPASWTEKFGAALDDDLAVPMALAEVHAARAEGNRALDSGDHETAMMHARSIRAMMAILGCDPLDERWESRDETSAALAAVDVMVQWALTQRQSAREQRDWAQADEIRDRLKDAGIDVTDTADGPQWALLDGKQRSKWQAIRSAAARCARTAARRVPSSGRAVSADAGSRARAQRRPRTSGPTTRPPSARPRRPSSSVVGSSARPTRPRSCSAATRWSSACAPGCPPPRSTSRSAPRPTSG